MLVSNYIELRAKTTEDQEECDVLVSVTNKWEYIVTVSINAPDNIT